MQKRCPNCMELLGEETACPICGYDTKLSEEEHPKLGTILKGRYYIGCIFSKDDVTTVYIGFDQELGSKVFIREFTGEGILDNENIPLNKSDMVDRYVSYGKSVAYISLCDILPRTVDVFKNDVGGYIINEYFEGKTLKDIMTSGILISEGNAYKIVGKLCDGLKIMHDSHMIYGNLCPTTLYILKDGGIKLFGLGSPFFDFVRDVDILAEVLNPSYAAPELFDEYKLNGSYCDVYSVAAILYRMLTNIIPPISFLRSGGETLVKPTKANAEIEKPISIAILNALNCQIEKRTFNTEMFLNELDDPNVRRRKGAGVGKAAFFGAFHRGEAKLHNGAEKDEKGFPMGIIVLFALGLLLLVGIVVLLSFIVPDNTDNSGSTSTHSTVSNNGDDGWYSESGNKHDDNYSTSSKKSGVVSDSSTPDTALPDDIVVCPNCVGFAISDAEKMLKEYGLKLGNITYEYTTTQIKGYVIAHKKGSEDGSKFQKGSKINLIVSKGYPPDNTADIPYVVGKDMMTAVDQFKSAGFSNVTYKFVTIDGKPAGEVVAMTPSDKYEPVPTDTAITVTINGVAITIPDYSGKTLKEAVETNGNITIATVGEDGNIQKVSEEEYSLFTVIGQNVSANSLGYSGMTITLTIIKQA